MRLKKKESDEPTDDNIISKRECDGLANYDLHFRETDKTVDDFEVPVTSQCVN